MPQPAIEVRGLRKAYGDVVAVDGLDLVVASGRTLALLGPNGAGKTTTVETCEGFHTPDAGSVTVLGLDPVADAATLRPRMGVMLQEQGVYPQAKPRETLSVAARMYADAHDVDELIETVELQHSLGTRFRDLSGGQRQRLCLALALVGRPEVLFLDEPTAGLDPAARRRTWGIVRGLQDADTTIVLTTHLLDEAEELAHDVVIIDHGRVVVEGTPDQLAADADVTFTTDRGVDLARLTGAVGHPVTVIGPRRHRLAATPNPQVLADLAAGLADQDVVLTSLQAGRGSLEELFLRLTGDTAAADAAEGSA